MKAIFALFFSSIIFFTCAFSQDLQLQYQSEISQNEFIGLTASDGIRFSKDGQYFIIITGISFQLWDYKTGLIIRNLYGHAGKVNSVDISKSNKYIISCSGDKTIKIWDTETGLCINTINCETENNQVRFMQDEEHIISLESGLYKNGLCKLILWDIKTAEIISSNILNMSDYNFDISPDDKYLVLCNHGQIFNGIKIFELPSLSEHKRFILRSKYVYNLTYTPDSKYILGLVGLVQPEIVVWNAKTGKRTNSFGNFSLHGMFDINPTEPILSITPMGKFQVWNYLTGELIYESNRNISECAFTKNGQFIVCRYGTDIDILNSKNFGIERTLKSFKSSARVIGQKDNQIIFPMDGSFQYFDFLEGKITKVIPSQVKAAGIRAFGNSNEYFTYYWSSPPTQIYKIEEAGMKLIDSDNSLWVWFSPDDTYKISFENNATSGKLSIVVKKLKTGENIKTPLSEFDGGGDIFISKNSNRAILIGQDMMLKVTSHYLFHKGAPIVRSLTDRSTLGVIAFDLPSEKALLTMEDKSFSNNMSFKTGNISADGEKIILAGDSLHLFDIKGNFIRTFNGELNNNIFDNMKVSFFNNDKYVISTVTDGYINIWDVNTGKLLHNLYNNSNCVDFKFIDNYNYIVTLGSDRSAKLWDLKTGKMLISYIGFENSEDYIFYSSDNNYMCSKGALDYVHFVIGKKIYLFDQFDLIYNRPDIILSSFPESDASLIKAYHEAYIKRLKKMHFTEEMLSREFHVPEISILNKENIQYNASEKDLKLFVKATDSKYKIDRVNVYINGVPLFGMNGKSLRKFNNDSVEIDFPVELSSGKNNIQVSCLNEKGAESLKESVEITYQPTTIKKPDLYIVTIGASEYHDKQWNLTYAAKDANDFAELFNDQKSNYESIYVNKIINQGVTVKNIREIKQKLQLSHVDDVVIIFYAGHGLLDVGLDYYLGTYNINFNKPGINGLKYEELDNLLDSIPARNKILFIDACHSGEVDKESSQDLITENVAQKDIVFRGVKPRGYNAISKIGYNNSFELMKEMFADLRKGTGAVVVSSAGGGEFAFEGENWKNGVFTYSLINGIKTFNADKNKDNKITVSELQDYIMNQVQKLTNGKQKPTMRQENIDNDFVIWF